MIVLLILITALLGTSKQERHSTVLVHVTIKTRNLTEVKATGHNGAVGSDQVKQSNISSGAEVDLMLNWTFTELVGLDNRSRTLRQHYIAVEYIYITEMFIQNILLYKRVCVLSLLTSVIFYSRIVEKQITKHS